MIPRVLRQTALERFAHYPVVTITGPRQSGKTSLCKQAFPKLACANLEDPETRERATADPRAFLLGFPHGAILDEVQRAPELMSALQVIVDERSANSQFVLSGSHNFQLHRAIAQSLAGRTTVLDLLPPSLDELRQFAAAPQRLDDVLRTGAYPRIHDQGIPAAEFLSDYVRTYVERDVRLVMNVQDLTLFQTFLRLCAGRSSQLLNLSALASDCGITQPTAKAWLSVLEASYLLTRVPPWHRNFGKRLVKSPKMYFLDSGLLCWLLGIRTNEQLEVHPLRGAVFESWVVAEILKARWNRGIADPIWFYTDQSRAEIDVVLELPGRLVLAEIKSGRRVAADAGQHLTVIGENARLDPMLVGEIEQVIVYGGELREQRQGKLLLPWDAIADFAWS